MASRIVNISGYGFRNTHLFPISIGQFASNAAGEVRNSGWDVRRFNVTPDNYINSDLWLAIGGPLSIGGDRFAFDIAVFSDNANDLNFIISSFTNYLSTYFTDVALTATEGANASSGGNGAGGVNASGGSSSTGTASGGNGAGGVNGNNTNSQTPTLSSLYCLLNPVACAAFNVAGNANDVSKNVTGKTLNQWALDNLGISSTTLIVGGIAFGLILPALLSRR